MKKIVLTTVVVATLAAGGCQTNQGQGALDPEPAEARNGEWITLLEQSLDTWGTLKAAHQGSYRYTTGFECTC